MWKIRNLQVGKQQQYELGQYLRDRYAKLLKNGRYSMERIYIQSTVFGKK